MADTPVILDVEQARFVCSGLSINLASARPGGFPNLARAIGCQLSEDRRTLRVFIAATPAAALLDDVRGNGRIAVTFSQPSSHRTLQLKADNARVLPFEAGERETVASSMAAFVTDVEPLGFSENLVRALLACEIEDVVAVEFNPTAIFSQTPGPNAGERLGVRP